MNLCKYKDLLGEPGKGVHSYRIFNIAIVDVVLTILVALLISFLAKVSFKWTLLILFLLGIILHRIFCVKTTIDNLIFQ
jgi:fatty acid desaturase